MTNFNPDEFWESRLTKVKGLEGVGYAKMGKSFNYWAYKIREYSFLSIIKEVSLKVEGKAVLDIGSGTGFYINLWNELKANPVVGMDITKVAVQNLQRTFPSNNFHVIDIGSDLLQIEEFKERFDIISTMDVLFHIVDDARFEKAIENISLMLKPGGHFIYSDNFLKGKTIRFAHQVAHSEETLNRLFRKSGLSPKRKKPFMVLSNYPIDSSNPFLRLYWYLLENSVALFKPLGYIAGLILYPVDKILINLVKDSPTTEVIVLQKKLTV